MAWRTSFGFVPRVAANVSAAHRSMEPVMVPAQSMTSGNEWLAAGGDISFSAFYENRLVHKTMNLIAYDNPLIISGWSMQRRARCQNGTRCGLTVRRLGI